MCDESRMHGVERGKIWIADTSIISKKDHLSLLFTESHSPPLNSLQTIRSVG